MGFWNKLGKIALQAAPYVAAPFTGGASLAFTGATNKLGQKWAEHDAKKAAEKGLAPSKFDKYLGMASSGASMATGIGAFGKALGGSGGKVGTGVGAGAAKNSIASMNTGGSGMGGWQSQLGNFAKSYAGNQLQDQDGGGGWQQMLAQAMQSRNPGPGGNYGTPPFVESRSPMGPSQNFYQDNRQAQGPVMPRGGYDWDNNPMNQLNQNNPNLSQSIFQGRQDAMHSQPFRGGYSIVSPGADEGASSTTQEMPPIYPQYQEPQQSYGDALTPRQGMRRRNPAG